jgi:hypothetical protein
MILSEENLGKVAIENPLAGTILEATFGLVFTTDKA